MNDLRRAKQVISRVLFVPEEMIDDDAHINAIKELDSLSFEALVLEIEDHVGREVDIVKLLELKTVRDVAVLLENTP